MSNHEFEALVSHLHVVGGRVVGAPPSGALVQLAPRSAPRSRERDAFFVITIPDGQHTTKAVFYEQMARWAAERYFEGQGGVTAGLQRVLASLNDNLVQHNARHPEQPFFAHMVCLVLRQQEVYIAKTDGAVALLWQHGGMRSFPSVAGGPVKGEFPLGRVSQPKFDIVRYIVEAGDILAVGGKNLFDAPAPELQVAGRRGDVQGTILRLKDLNYQAVSAMVLQFVPPHVAGQASAPSPAAAGSQPPAGQTSGMPSVPAAVQRLGEAAAAPAESVEPRGAPSPDA
ncbi:MAG: hypothetical protein JXN59_08735, partial [Anaerolineae bacterium]|nr:hypothetical protein [Anaerolineae bacterium]